MEGLLEDKTYELYAVNKVNDALEVMHLQVLNGNIIIDMEAKQIFNGTIHEYMKYCSYDLQSIEEKDIPCTRKLSIINSTPIYF